MNGAVIRSVTMPTGVGVLVGVAPDRVAATSRYADPLDGGDEPAADRRRELIATRALLRALLEPAAVRVDYEPGGRPRLADGAAPWVSVSHAGGWSAAAVCAAAVGIDVQPPEPDRAAGSAGVPVVPAGASPVSRPGRPDPSPEWTWVVREACVKATGQGLAGLPHRIAVPPGSAAGTWRPPDRAVVHWRRLTGLPVPVAVAVVAPPPDDLPARRPPVPPPSKEHRR